MNPETQGRWRVQKLRCFSCEARQEAGDALAESGGSTHGLFLSTHLVDDIEDD